MKTVYSNELGALVLLGYVSATESYLRAVIREIINNDEFAQMRAESKEISFGAVVHSVDSKLLPEALLEGISLAGARNVARTLRELCGITGMSAEGPPTQLQNVFDEFAKICHLRHCCTHRFGKLGSKQALELGISEHKEFLETPIKLTEKHLQDIGARLLAFVGSLNAYLFKDVLERTSGLVKNIGKTPFKYSHEWEKMKRKIKSIFQNFIEFSRAL
ncbi:hypothetical protein ACQUFY_25540 (plasmid) [Robbsia andropogonis]|uniref:hypothetical protein n=1 Tax=Robbsia andropogonis TaxID=28092 RepID=UPI003D1FD2B9